MTDRLTWKVGDIVVIKKPQKQTKKKAR